uniref:DUF1735 domain-containing protein n=1 Tax=uncultured Draconibacterium sp. TaxID=1573823 RepID=UPI003217C8C9
MKKTKILYIAIILIAGFFTGCETDGIDDLEQQEPVVLFDSETYNANIVLTDVDKIPEIRVRLMGQSLETDINVTVEIDEANTTAVIGSEFVLEAASVTIKAGESYASVPFSIDRDALEADVNKTVALLIASVAAPARKAETGAELILKKTIIDVSAWLGDYTYVADGWERDMEIRAVSGENYKVILYNFWGNELDMEGTIDISDPYAPKIIVPAGAFLSWGWDEMGDWYLKNDLIGVMDNSKMEIVFTQFDFITDDGTAGSFPWCQETCKMEKN